jgi:AraC-like DNA-binding protein
MCRLLQALGDRGSAHLEPAREVAHGAGASPEDSSDASTDSDALSPARRLVSHCFVLAASRRSRYRSLVPHPIRSGARARRLAATRDFICDHLDEPLTLEDLALHAGLSRFALVRQFAASFGQTPHAYLTAMRLARAKELLAASDRPVTEICLDVGFTSLGSFSALFARRVGASPLAYRRGLRRLVAVPAWPVAVVPFCFLGRLG